MAKSLSMSTGRMWYDNVDPGVSETEVEQGNFWLNFITGDLFFCFEPTFGAQIWKKITFVAQP